MGSALVLGILKKEIIDKNKIHIVEPNISIRKKLRSEGLIVYSNIKKINITKLNINTILLAVKPQIIKQVLIDLKKIINNRVSLISIVAGKNVKFYEENLGIKNIIRAMPNTPARISKGVTAIYAKTNVLKKYKKESEKLFLAVGETLWLKKESDMDIVTAISGSGPAYVFKFIESMIDSAIKAGLNLKVAEKLVKHTLLGSSILANESIYSPKKLREEVTSPGGTTEAAIKVLEKNNQFEKVINLAVKSAIERSIILSK